MVDAGVCVCVRARVCVSSATFHAHTISLQTLFYRLFSPPSLYPLIPASLPLFLATSIPLSLPPYLSLSLLSFLPPALPPSCLPAPTFPSLPASPSSLLQSMRTVCQAREERDAVFQHIEEFLSLQSPLRSPQGASRRKMETPRLA